MADCTHLDHVQLLELPESVEGCEDCLAAGTEWFHLRICLECGHVGCCDSSPMRHASGHASASEHPIMRSIRAGRGLVVVRDRRGRDEDHGGPGAAAHPAFAAGLSLPRPGSGNQQSADGDGAQPGTGSPRRTLLIHIQEAFVGHQSRFQGPGRDAHAWRPFQGARLPRLRPPDPRRRRYPLRGSRYHRGCALYLPRQRRGGR